MTNDLTPPHWGTAGIEAEVLTRMFGNISQIDWARVLRENLTLPLPLPEVLNSWGVNRALYKSNMDTAIEALRFADGTFRDLGWHSKWEVTSAALAQLRSTKSAP